MFIFRHCASRGILFSLSGKTGKCQGTLKLYLSGHTVSKTFWPHGKLCQSRECTHKDAAKMV